MKICFLINSSSVNAGRCMRYFAQLGHEVHAVSFEYPRQTIPHVRYHIVPANKRFLFFTLLFKLIQFRQVIKTIKPDIIDTHYVIKYGFIAALVNYHPFVVTAVGSDILTQPQRNPMWKFVAKYTLKKADLIVCRSPMIRDEILGLGIETNKMRIILLGVDSERFHSTLEDKKVRQELGIGQSAPVVISTRNLAPIYDLETLINAVPLVLADAPEVKFIIIGQGNQQIYLQKLAKTLGISASVIFTGSVPHADIPQKLSSSDIYVSTSLSDGTSNSLLEAMSCELAPVVTNIPANQRWIKDGINGYLVPIKKPEALAGRIISLLKNEKARKSFGIKNRIITQKYAEQRTEMGKLADAYQDLLAQRIMNK